MRVFVRLFVFSTLACCLVAHCSAQFRFPNTPVQHIIVLVQENRSPGNLFFADKALINKGAHLVGSGSCKGKTITLTPWQLDACFDPDHSHTGGWVATYDGGKMDGACTTNGGVQTGCGVPPCPNTAYATCPEYTYVPNTLYDGVHGILEPYF